MAQPEKYVVVGWYCKTQSCGEFHGLAYLGPKSQMEGKTTHIKGMPKDGPTITCPRCQKAYHFQRSELRQLEMDDPPPPDTEFPKWPTSRFQ